MLHDADPVWLAIQVLQLFMAAVSQFVSRHGLKIEACHRNQPNKSKLVLLKPLLKLLTVI